MYASRLARSAFHLGWFDVPRADRPRGRSRRQHPVLARASVAALGHARPSARQPSLANNEDQIGILTIIDQGIATPFLESIFDIRNGQPVRRIQTSLEFVSVNRFHIHIACVVEGFWHACLLYTSPSPRDRQKSRMPSSA